jgi:hypothetical protein
MFDKSSFMVFLSALFSYILFSPRIMHVMSPTNVFDLQVFMLGSGSHPLLWDICTDCKNEKFSFPRIVSSCFCCEVTLIRLIFWEIEFFYWKWL